MIIEPYIKYYEVYEMMAKLKKHEKSKKKEFAQYYIVNDRKAYYTNGCCMLVFDTVEEDGIYGWGKDKKAYITTKADSKIDMPSCKKLLEGSSDKNIYGDTITFEYYDNFNAYVYYFLKTLPDNRWIDLDFLKILFETGRQSNYQINNTLTTVKFCGSGLFDFYVALMLRTKDDT